MFTVTLADGKYEVTNNNGVLTVTRNGEPWQAANNSLVGDGLSLAMMHKIEELQTKLDLLTPAREEFIKKPVLNEDGSLRQYIIKMENEVSFRCEECGCSVFHKPDDTKLELYECNVCGTTFIGE